MLVVNAKSRVCDGQSEPNNGLSQAQPQMTPRESFISHSHFQSMSQTSLSNEKAISRLKKKQSEKTFTQRSREIKFTKLIYRWNRWEEMEKMFSFAELYLTEGI